MHTPRATTSDIELLLIAFNASDPDFGLGRSVLRGMYLNSLNYPRSLEIECDDALSEVSGAESLVDPVNCAGRMADEPHGCAFGDPCSC